MRPLILDGLELERKLGNLSRGADLEKDGVGGVCDRFLFALDAQVSADNVLSRVQSHGLAGRDVGYLCVEEQWLVDAGNRLGSVSCRSPRGVQHLFVTEQEVFEAGGEFQGRRVGRAVLGGDVYQDLVAGVDPFTAGVGDVFDLNRYGIRLFVWWGRRVGLYVYALGC